MSERTWQIQVFKRLLLGEQAGYPAKMRMETLLSPVIPSRLQPMPWLLLRLGLGQDSCSSSLSEHLL